MSIISNGGNMNGPIFHEFKKQASFFLKEKIKTARLALTDVTQAQLLTEEATNGNPGCPDARTLKMISRAAFEIDDYWRIVDILHKRLERFDKTNWRASYKALIVLEHLLTHGPARVAEEFQSDRDVIQEMEQFHHIEEKGFNWGQNVRKKSERILKLLEKGPILKEERDRARKVSFGIQGFGSFCVRTESPLPLTTLDRCKSEEFNEHHTKNEEDFFDENYMIKTETEKPLLSSEDSGTRVDCKENLGPVESKAYWHPFDEEDENITVMSLLPPAPHMQAC